MKVCISHKSKVLILMLACFCLLATVQAQPLLSVTEVQDSCGVYLVHLTRPYPAIESSMPWDVKIAYLVADTLCKTYTLPELKHYVKYLSDDSLVIAFRNMFRLDQYDLLLSLHSWSQTDRDKDVLGYKSSYKDLQRQITIEYQKRFFNSDFSELQNAILSSDGGIYRIKAISYSHRVTTGDPVYDTLEFWCGEVEIIDKIYGDHINTVVFREGDEQPHEGLTVTWKRPFTPPKDYPEQQRRKFGEEFLIPGQEYLIFLFLDPKNGSIAQSYNWRFVLMAFNKYPIVNETVTDLPEEWNLGESASYQQVKIFLGAILNEVQLK